MIQGQAISEDCVDEVNPQKPRVRGVTSREVPRLGVEGVSTQHVFELILTHLLVFSGSLASPSHAS